MRSKLVDGYTGKVNGVPMACLWLKHHTGVMNSPPLPVSIRSFALPVPAAAGMQATMQRRPIFISGAVTENEQAETITHGRPGAAAPPSLHSRSRSTGSYSVALHLQRLPPTPLPKEH
jgi:hypothetical protein